MNRDSPSAARRRLLAAIAASIGAGGLRGVLAEGRAPAIITPDSVRPSLPSGVMTGDVTDRRAMLWSRASRPSRMMVEVATTESMRGARRIAGPLALAANDCTARLDLAGLAPGQTYFYRVHFEDVADRKIVSPTAIGRFRTPHDEARDIVFAFSGDEAGQGWGINEAWGGYRIYETMRRFEPDFFIHAGDQIYADVPMTKEVLLDDGNTWNNLVTPAKRKVAETLDDFRGNFAYNLLDENKRRFCAEVPMLVQWDDHEVHNNWFPGEVIDDAFYRERDMSLLSRRANRAMFEYNAMRHDAADPSRVYRSFRMGPLLDVFMLDERSYRGPNSPNRQPARGRDADFLGPAQMEWLKRSLTASRATWKVIASDMPISIAVSSKGRDGDDAYEAWANRDDGAPSGRELELAELFRFIKRRRVRNVVWVTADVHYPSATVYRPERAAVGDFDPFWEFVAGPMHAGTFGPNPIDRTFGPEVRFVGIPPGMKQNRPPSDGLQFFGIGRIDARTSALTMSLHRGDGDRVFTVELPAVA